MAIMSLNSLFLEMSKEHNSGANRFENFFWTLAIFLVWSVRIIPALILFFLFSSMLTATNKAHM